MLFFSKKISGLKVPTSKGCKCPVVAVGTKTASKLRFESVCWNWSDKCAGQQSINKVTEACLRHPPTAICLNSKRRDTRSCAAETHQMGPEDSASQVDEQYLETMGSVETTRGSLPPPPPPPMSGAQRLQGADQVCRRSLLQHLHPCSHHQHQSFLRSSAKTHRRERLPLHRPDLMLCVPRRRLRGRRSRRHCSLWRRCWWLHSSHRPFNPCRLMPSRGALKGGFKGVQGGLPGGLQGSFRGGFKG